MQMKKIQNRCIGVHQGDVSLFSDFESGGPMWTGKGPRERRYKVKFSESYKQAPAVQVAISLWDMDTDTAVRAELVAENVTADGFDIVFRTWMDSRVARVRASWTAFGELPNDDDWDVE